MTINGTAVQVVTQASKNNEIYVLNAATGKPVYAPIKVGPPESNNWNDGLTSNSTPAANLTASQALFGNSQEICPGTDGGIEMAPAIAGNMLYAVTQNACGANGGGAVSLQGCDDKRIPLHGRPDRCSERDRLLYRPLDRPDSLALQPAGQVPGVIGGGERGRAVRRRQGGYTL